MRKVKFLLGLIIVLISLNVSAQEQKYPVMTFKETSHDFGTIHEKDVVKHVFKFKNTGNAPLLITNMRASCGCTAANYSKKPILPGEEGQFTVTFNSAYKPHKQHKRVTITCNTKKGKEYVNITADVIPDPGLEKIRQKRREDMRKRREEAMKKRQEAKKNEKKASNNKENLVVRRQEIKGLKEQEKDAAKKVEEAKKLEKEAKAEKKKIKQIRKIKSKIAKANKKIAKLQKKINKYNKKLRKLQR